MRGRPFQKGHKLGMTGKKHSEVTKRKIGNANKGKTLGAKQPSWKGEDCGYRVLHTWVQQRLGKASFCVFGDINCKGRFEWANINHQYKRDLNDFISMCKFHHAKWDVMKRKEKQS